MEDEGSAAPGIARDRPGARAEKGLCKTARSARQKRYRSRTKGIATRLVNTIYY